MIRDLLINVNFHYKFFLHRFAITLYHNHYSERFIITDFSKCVFSTSLVKITKISIGGSFNLFPAKIDTIHVTLNKKNYYIPIDDVIWNNSLTFSADGLPYNRDKKQWWFDFSFIWRLFDLFKKKHDDFIVMREKQPYGLKIIDSLNEVSGALFYEHGKIINELVESKSLVSENYNGLSCWYFIECSKLKLLFIVDGDMVYEPDACIAKKRVNEAYFSRELKPNVFFVALQKSVETSHPVYSLIKYHSNDVVPSRECDFPFICDKRLQTLDIRYMKVGRRLYEIIREFVEDYVDIYYKKDADVAKDLGLQKAYYYYINVDDVDFSSDKLNHKSELVDVIFRVIILAHEAIENEFTYPDYFMEKNSFACDRLRENLLEIAR